MRNPAFAELIEEIKRLHDSKNHDYAENADPLSNLRRSEKLGIPAWQGVLVRLTDKWSRIEQLVSGKTPKHESLRDSLMDNAVYSLLAILLLDESPAPDVEAPATSGLGEPMPRFGRAFAGTACTTTQVSVPTAVTAGSTGE